jgi:GDP-4-dehydro-6-deoxy-D-mannose reductase
MKTLILGGSGFVGSHMKSRSPKWSETSVVGSNVDIRDKKALSSLIEITQPDYVVNLASITTVRETVSSPKDAYDISFYGTLNILEVLRDQAFHGTFLYISSSEVYGYPDVSKLPLNESSILNPMSPYSVGKLAAEYLCSFWQKDNNFKIVIARPFTHIGPGQSERFSIASFSNQISKIVQLKQDPIIKVGDLNTTRDFTDVRDIVDAYWLILEHGKAGEIYNVCSGIERKISFVLKKLIYLSNKIIDVKIESDRLRVSEQQRILGSAKKLEEDTGWRPAIDFEETLKDMLNYYLQKDHNKLDV